MAFRVTPLAEDEGAEKEGAEEAGGTAILIWDYLGWSWASLHRTVAASMVHMTEKCVDSKEETEKRRRSLVIAEGKMSLSRLAISL